MQSTRRSFAALLTAVLLAVPCTSARAQTLQPGTRVRVKSSQVVVPIIGSYQGMRRDTLVVIEDGAGAQVWTFTSSAVDRLETSAGMKGRNRKPTARWALIGAGVGAAAGWLTAVLLESASSNQEYNDVISALIGGGAGAAFGAVYGSHKLEEHWTPVPIPPRVGILPTRNGMRFSLSASF
jgi:hypothetical protein